MTRMRSPLWLFLLLSISSRIALAQTPPADRWQFRQFQVENDVFPLPYSQPGDRFYTNGLRLSFGKSLTEDQSGSSLPFWLRPIRKACPSCEIAPNVAFGQQMFTPEDIENPDPQPGERPWAAWLYTGIGGTVDTSARSRHDFEIQLGITGDAAGGKFGQRLWHKFSDSPKPRGWDNQFGPDVGINAYYSFQHILLSATDDSMIDWDFVPSVKAATGTITTFAGTGATVRIGRNISDYPYSPIRPSERRARVNRLPKLEIYGFVGADVRVVAYNYFLEGSLFDTEPLIVDPERYVWDFNFGVTARFDRYNITYAIVRRSEEFDRQVGDDSGIHSFASLSLTVGLR